MCYLPPLIHQLWFGFHPPPVSPTYQSNRFLATFQCQSHSQLKAKVLLRWVRNITIYDELYDMWSVPPAASVDGPSGSSQCVQGDTVCQRGRIWIGNDMCQEGLSALQSEVMWGRWDRIRMAGEGRQTAQPYWHEHIYLQVLVDNTGSKSLLFVTD